MWPGARVAVGIEPDAHVAEAVVAEADVEAAGVTEALVVEGGEPEEAGVGEAAVEVAQVREAVVEEAGVAEADAGQYWHFDNNVFDFSLQQYWPTLAATRRSGYQYAGAVKSRPDGGCAPGSRPPTTRHGESHS
jgi:hypothetical protein